MFPLPFFYTVNVIVPSRFPSICCPKLGVGQCPKATDIAVDGDSVRGTLAAEFSNLPPNYMEAEEFDCLHDKGTAYARALHAAGVNMQLEDVPGILRGSDFSPARVSHRL